MPTVAHVNQDVPIAEAYDVQHVMIDVNEDTQLDPDIKLRQQLRAIEEELDVARQKEAVHETSDEELHLAEMNDL